MHSRPILTSSQARAVVDKALVVAAELNLSISVAVVDDGGYVLAVHKMDKAGKLTPKVAFEKARTAALMRAPSGAMQARLKDEPALLRLTDYLPMAGGLPVIHAGECAGAVGISGGTAEQDVLVATSALAAIGD